MAGPILQLPEFLDPSKKSVFDPLSEQLMRKAAGTLGTDDPKSVMSDLTNPTGVPVAGLISKIPFETVPTRISVIKQLLENQQAPEELKQAVEFAAKKYPRVLAHVNSVEVGDLGKLGHIANHTAIDPKIVRWGPKVTSIIKVDPKAVEKYKDHLGMVDTFGHELTHAAQTIWNKPERFPSRYQLQNDLWGYKDNIYEKGARRAGENFKNKFYFPANNKKLIKSETEITTPTPNSLLDQLLKRFL